jgi:hypothetical protein
MMTFFLQWRIALHGPSLVCDDSGCALCLIVERDAESAVIFNVLLRFHACCGCNLLEK